MNFKKLALVAALACTALATSANAAIVVNRSVDTIGLTPGFTAANQPFQNFLVRFTLGANTNLNGADIYSDFANGNLLGTSATIKFRLDNAGAPAATDVLNFAANINAVDNVGSSTQPTIKRLHVDFGALNFGPGTYWFGLSGTSSEIGWNLQFSSPGADPLYQLSFSNVVGPLSNTKAAFNLYSAAPEPASWALMLVGFGAAGYAMRTRRRTTATLTA